MPADENRFSGRILYPMYVLAVFPAGHRLSRCKVLEVVELANEPLLRLTSSFASHGWFGQSLLLHHVAHIRPRRAAPKASRRRQRSSHWPEPATVLLWFPLQ